MTATLHLGDCLEVLPTIADESIDSIVTDPPYGFGFMGKAWDALPPGREVFEQCLRVLKPGGHLIAFGGSRTYHRLACAVEDAGFEIRDQIQWIYGSGFPKSLDVSKAFDKAAGAEREVVGSKLGLPGYHLSAHNGGEAFGDGLSSSTKETRAASPTITAPATPEAMQWDGWGTALKPAHEPAVLALRPLCGTVIENVKRYGVGALNIDGCRVPSPDGVPLFNNGVDRTRERSSYDTGGSNRTGDRSTVGRFPANLIHNGSPEVLALFPETGKISAARYFYCAKASKKDRTEGGAVDNKHPTVKPADLMAYLCRLVTPPGGIVLDPFMGSGSTGKAAIREGFSFVGIERDADSFATAQARIGSALGSLFKEAC